MRVANINRQIAEELGIREQQVEATVALLDGGATVPFVARYRKEITGALDDAQLRTLEERLNYLRELEERRTAILDSVREQGKLDAALEAAILAADSKGRLEDIYLPFKPKRRTKAEIAKEAGLEPLADLLLTQPESEPQALAAPFVDAGKQVADVEAALDGARAILVERFAEDADLIGGLREQMWSNGWMTSKVRRGKKTEGEKFKDYFDFSEPLTKLPSHRILAMFRGEKEEILDLQMLPEPPGATPAAVSSYELKIMQRFAISDQGRPGDKWLIETVRWAWRTRIQVHLNVDLADAAVDRGRAGSHTRVRVEPARPAARRAGRRARHHGARSRLSLRRQGRGRRRDRQGGCHRHGLSARAGAALGRSAGRAGQARARASRRPDRDRQRHRVARDRQARDRTGETAAGIEDVEDRGVGSRRIGLLRIGLCFRGTAGSRRHPARRGIDRAAAAGSPGRAGQDRSEGDRGRAVSA